MTMKSLFLFCLFGSAISAYADASCDALKESLSVRFELKTNKLAAGTDLQFDAMFTPAQQNLLDGWSNVIAQVWLENGVVGSKSLQYFLPLKENNELVSLLQTVSDKIPENFIGNYNFKAAVYARGGTNEPCIGNLNAVQAVEVNVANDSSRADISPPIVSNVQFDKTFYEPGERVQVTFRAIDKSEICTAIEKEKNLCEAVWHQNLVAVDNETDVGFFQPIFRKGTNIYGTEFYLPSNAKPGKYRLTIINLDDIHGNGSAYLSESEQVELVIIGSSDLKTKVDEVVNPLVGENPNTKKRYMGAVVGIIKGNERFVFGLGQKSKEDNTPPKADSIFEIGSVTKTFTGLALAQSIVENTAQLDDPVQRHLAGVVLPKFDGAEITLRHLATHSSGLSRVPENLHPADTLDPYKGYKFNDLKEYLERFQLSQAPGSEFKYSNTGMGTLGYILATQSNTSYDDLIKEKIAIPLYMFDTRVNLSGLQNYRFLNGYMNGKSTPHWSLENNDVLAGHGMLRSTPQDLLKFAQANINPETTKIASALNLSQLKHSDYGPFPGSSMGLGWVRINNNDLLMHDGATYGFQSFVIIDRKDKLAVVVLTNSYLTDDATGAIDDRPTLVGFELLKYLKSAY